MLKVVSDNNILILCLPGNTWDFGLRIFNPFKTYFKKVFGKSINRPGTGKISRKELVVS